MEYERGKKKPVCLTIEALKAASRDETKAVEFMESRRWPDGAECPYCASRAVYKMRKRGTEEREKNYRWRCKQCETMFTVRIGTVMEETRLPLRVWCLAFWRGCASKKGVSALQISREAGISYKSALFLMHRVRYVMAQPDEPQPLSGEVEVDETYVGGRPRKVNKEKNQGMYHTRLQTVVGMVERGGNVRLRHPKKPKMRRVGKEQIQELMLAHVARTAQIFTDESKPYLWTKGYFADHQSVNHAARQYARKRYPLSAGKPLVTTNTIEGVFGLLKRGVYGTFHSVSKDHLHRYLAEFEFRYNRRKIDDGPRVSQAIKAAEGKRLRYDDYVVREAV